ncbi:uncharacterized protein LOC132195792 [Neocloeon triangulifer]|uniref:uncharacterized protein LOC132195792 n=1 Tax=Neocloeon triangulifer TaxID=2078957 RepID=UPI00286EBC5C|nr:uncharacterized protein LOC132195792 [Neocloeon triangulifer]
MHSPLCWLCNANLHKHRLKRQHQAAIWNGGVVAAADGTLGLLGHPKSPEFSAADGQIRVRPHQRLQTKKTGAIVSKYLAKLPQGTVLQSIDCFSRAVAAMKLAFSANGFFAIDWEILFSSASACTVNTLILIQSYVNNNQQVAFEAE